MTTSFDVAITYLAEQSLQKIGFIEWTLVHYTNCKNFTEIQHKIIAYI